MIAKLVPVILAVSGLGAGAGAGILLRPDAAPEVAAAAAPCGHPVEGGTDHAPDAADPQGQDPAAGHAAGESHGAAGAAGTEFVKIDNQFVVPVIENQEVAAMVILSLSLEVATGQADGTYARLPKLRDRFLRAMLDHANVGGFSGTFTADGSIEQLRRNLVEVGRKELGAVLSDVLILDLNRQTV